MITSASSKFINALSQLEKEGILDQSILINAASLRILGIRVYTYFIDLLVQKSYYFTKTTELNFSPKYELEPVSLRIADFPLRLGTISGGLCSFRHLIEPYNIYEEVEFQLDAKVKLIKIRPHDYVRKDCEAAIENMIQRFDERYWQDLYSYHKQIEAIDLGMSKETMKFGPQQQLKFEE
jgi:hydroxymethylpyrimidine pyrophosphatase-like HAD family hydrolase